ncbi:LysR family transcriptional regulator [Pelagicoccus sp. SDUM812003]|uniref:LysR family transcriptional regulator n=1 Tax=Pelagicoccus sp. SDUM812003 TaxID=3041267 RepID=UPI00280FC2A1|nr:LysR family transcriptional regulator [Pelagicoccus sp. SDUM812003]MDQ8201694.1 LysR family transcriptional regulator [Pelagicoccus sp. SDUM812003]
MELHQLKYFLAVAEEGNFTRAAEKCFVSQPSLSAQIIKLEGELGQKLFNRLGRKAELTQAGRFLESRARTILMEVENAQRQIKESAEEITGVVKVGVTPSVTPYLIPPALSICRERYPKLQIHIQENLRRRLIDEVVQGHLEVAISSYTGDTPIIDAEPLLQEALVLAVSAKHPLASQKEAISINDFKDEPLVLLGESATLGDKVFDFFDRMKIEPKVVALCSQVRSLKELVNLGIGVAILPEMAIDETQPFNIVYRSLVSARMSRLLFALTHARRYLSPGARVFIDLVREVAYDRGK